MRREAAVSFLRNDCVFDPPLSEADAQALWQEHRARVAALPERTPEAPREIALTPDEQEHARRFRDFLASSGVRDILEVVKLDVSQLTALQHFVVTERSQSLAHEVQQPGDWLAKFLPLAARGQLVQYSFRQTAPMTSCIEFQLPHAEFVFQPNPAIPGHFHLVECLRHVTVMKGADRTFLSTGYHRTYARIMSTPAAQTPSALVAVVRNNLENAASPGPALPTGAGPPGPDPLGPFGSKAARLGDFFTDGCFAEVDLVQRRFELQLQATVVALDERRSQPRPTDR